MAATLAAIASGLAARVSIRMAAASGPSVLMKSGTPALFSTDFRLARSSSSADDTTSLCCARMAIASQAALMLS
ncbi:hypothetical protein D3C72_2484120 [compost metagenome]